MIIAIIFGLVGLTVYFLLSENFILMLVSMSTLFFINMFIDTAKAIADEIPEVKRSDFIINSLLLSGKKTGLI